MGTEDLNGVDGYEDEESVLAGINYDSDEEYMGENKEGGDASA